jgi:hypothetical protein
MKNTQDREATIWLAHPVYSADPIDYDLAVHHIAFTCVFASLATQYCAGEFRGILASSWSASDDFRTWSFEIRPNLFFENGDPITPEAVRKSLTRIAFLQRQRQSYAGVTNHLVDAGLLTHATAKFPGIVVDGHSIVLNFSVPMVDLLKQLSFGIYSITHASDFDEISGEWHDPRQCIASGAYRISEWSNDTLTLTLRDNFPNSLRHQGALGKYVFDTTSAHRFNCDIVMGADLEPEFRSRFVFFGPEASDIAFVLCNSWNYGLGPCHDFESRTFLRWRFYEELKRQNIAFVRSFFPLSVRDVHEMPEPIPVEPPKSSSVATSPAAIFKSNIPFSTIPPVVSALKLAFASLGVESIERSIPAHLLNSEEQPKSQDHHIDVCIRITGVHVSSPDADIRFMVNSKEGIKLPDPTGNLKKIVNRAQFSPQEVNEQLWNDAVVWPLFHLSFGLWAKVGLFDLSQLNTSLPPTDLSWVGKK